MNHGRQLGVRIPENQSSEQAPTMTVTNLTKAEVFLIEYGDERGLKHTSLCFVVGNKAFLPPQGDAWTAGFKPFTEKLNEQIMDRISATRPTRDGQVPQKDEVDVLGTGNLGGGPDATPEQIEAAEQALRTGT